MARHIRDVEEAGDLQVARSMDPEAITADLDVIEQISLNV
jgi:hypothetical protein